VLRGSPAVQQAGDAARQVVRQTGGAARQPDGGEVHELPEASRELDRSSARAVVHELPEASGELERNSARVMMARRRLPALEAASPPLGRRVCFFSFFLIFFDAKFFLNFFNSGCKIFFLHFCSIFLFYFFSLKYFLFLSIFFKSSLKIFYPQFFNSRCKIFSSMFFFNYLSSEFFLLEIVFIVSPIFSFWKVSLKAFYHKMTTECQKRKKMAIDRTEPSLRSPVNYNFPTLAQLRAPFLRVAPEVEIKIY